MYALLVFPEFIVSIFGTRSFRALLFVDNLQGLFAGENAYPAPRMNTLHTKGFYLATTQIVLKTCWIARRLYDGEKDQEREKFVGTAQSSAISCEQKNIQ